MNYMLNSSLKNSVFVHFCYVRTLCSRTESYRDPSAWAWFSLYGGWYVSTLCFILPSPVDYSVLWLALKYNDVECDSSNGVPVLSKDSRHILAVMETLAKRNLLVLDSLLVHALINYHTPHLLKTHQFVLSTSGTITKNILRVICKVYWI